MLQKSNLTFFFSKLYFYFSNSFKIIFLRLLDNSHITKQPSKINSSSKNCFYSENNITAIKNSSFLFFFFNFLSSQTDPSNQNQSDLSKFHFNYILMINKKQFIQPKQISTDQNHTTKIQYTWAKDTNFEFQFITQIQTRRNQIEYI